jgi:predicted AAA+ superfamily ATPase
MIIARALQKTIESSLQSYPVVGLVGSRQVGKTTLAGAIRQSLAQANYLDLELPSDLNKLHDPELYLRSLTDSLVIIDEIQRLPSLFPLIRALVDQHRRVGRFLILGSASPDLLRQSSESLAGRIIYHELAPLMLKEVGYRNIENLWLRGGYPSSYLAETDDAALQWRQTFIQTYLERDIPLLGLRIPAGQLRRFWTMLAHVHGQLWNGTQVAGSLDVSAPTVRRYLDILADTFITRVLPPYHANVKKRLVKAPKVYLRDAGLLHTLLGISSWDVLMGHPALGRSWEGFAIEQVLGAIPDLWQAYFYRTTAGAEIDLLLLNEQQEPIAVECKYSLSPKLSKGFWHAWRDLSCKKGYVIYPGTETFPLGPEVMALPVRDIDRIVGFRG